MMATTWSPGEQNNSRKGRPLPEVVGSRESGSLFGAKGVNIFVRKMNVWTCATGTISDRDHHAVLLLLP